MNFQLLMPGLSILVILIVTVLAFQWQNMALLYGFASLPLVVFLISRPVVWFSLLLALYYSGIKFPQAPMNLNAFHLLASALVVFLVAHRILHRTPTSLLRGPRLCALVFITVLLFVMSVRGIGLRMFGSNLWGGARYVVLLIHAALYLSLDSLTLSPRQWQRALVIMYLLAVMPLLAQLLYVFSGGAIYQQYYFIQAGAFIASTLEAVETGAGVSRFSTGLFFLFMYIPFMVYARPLRGKAGVVTWLCIAGALVAVGFSGFRTSILQIIIFLGLWFLLGTRRPNVRGAVLFTLLVGAVLTVVALNARHFPVSVQRALSFIPFADVSWVAKIDAQNTASWRFEIWRDVLHLVPQYLWIGQGLAFNPHELLAYAPRGFAADYQAVVTQSYHNGPLSLLLTLGLPGFLAGTAFLWVILRRHYRLCRQPWPDTLLERMHRVQYIVFVAGVVVFFLIYGDVHMSFPLFFLQALLLEGLERSRGALAVQAGRTVAARVVPRVGPR